VTSVAVKLEGLSVRQKLEALAAHYGIDRASMQTMSVLEFAARIALAKSRGGTA
jgi:hypothetical protein